MIKKTKKTAKKKVVGRKVKKTTVVKKIKTEKAFNKVHGKPIGTVAHFYGNIKVAIVKFKKPVKAGMEVRFCGATSDFSQKIESMQLNHKPISVAPKGKLIGLKVKKRVREGDEVYGK